MPLQIDIVTLFPEVFPLFLQIGPLRAACEKGLLKVGIHNLRDFADSFKGVDDYPYGGGAGMILKVEPIYRVINKLRQSHSMVILLSPQGVQLTQNLAVQLKDKEHLILICGRYKGIDERVMKYVDLELSIGDYILSGGEIPALVVLDSLSRLLPGALGDEASGQTDSFINGLLDAPYYTRPQIFDGMEVPPVLLSGDHEKIRKWRRREALKKTLAKRPDLLDKLAISKEEIKKELENPL